MHDGGRRDEKSEQRMSSGRPAAGGGRSVAAEYVGQEGGTCKAGAEGI